MLLVCTHATEQLLTLLSVTCFKNEVAKDITSARRHHISIITGCIITNAALLLEVWCDRHHTTSSPYTLQQNESGAFDCAHFISLPHWYHGALQKQGQVAASTPNAVHTLPLSCSDVACSRHLFVQMFFLASMMHIAQWCHYICKQFLRMFIHVCFWEYHRLWHLLGLVVKTGGGGSREGGQL